MKTALLIELAETWEAMAAYQGNSDDALRARRETLRECADALMMDLEDSSVPPVPVLTAAQVGAGRG